MEREYIYGQSGMIGGYVGQPGERRGLASTVTKKNVRLEFEKSRPSPFDQGKLSMVKGGGNERSCTDIAKISSKVPSTLPQSRASLSGSRRTQFGATGGVKSNAQIISLI